VQLARRNEGPGGAIVPLVAFGLDVGVISLGRNGIENHVKRTSEAREAIARVAQYEPLVRPYYQDAVIKGDRPQEIIRLLLEAKSRYVRTSRTNR
jgi:hypothetical protein